MIEWMQSVDMAIAEAQGSDAFVLLDFFSPT